MTTANYSFGDIGVSMAMDADTPLGPLEDLHICHLGMKFISSKPLPLFSIYEFNMSFRPGQPDDDSMNMNCSGIVVSSEPEGNGYRTVIHFADLGQTDAGSLEALTKASRMRCEDCGNC